MSSTAEKGPRSDQREEMQSILSELEEEGYLSTNPRNASLDVLVETPELLKKSIQQLQETFALLPNSQKEAYLQAVSSVPDIVVKESSPLDFLRCESFNAFAAAQRLVAYWDLRKKIFGERDFLRPMDLTGNGALNDKDIEILKADMIAAALLPADGKGRSVLYLDRSRSLSPYLSQSRLRCTFFLLSAIAQNETSRYKGVVVICRSAADQKRPEHIAVSPRSPMDMVRLAFPIRLSQVHVVCCSPEQRIGNELGSDKKLLAPIQRNDVEFVHFVGSEPEVLSTLTQQQFGLERSGLPQCFGGNWTIASFLQWVEHRRTTDVKEVENNTEKTEAKIDLSAVAVFRNNVPSLESLPSSSSSSQKSSMRADGNFTKPHRRVQVHSTRHDKRMRLSDGQPYSSSSENLGVSDSSEIWTKESEGRIKPEVALNAIANEGKIAYLKAKEDIPHLVTTNPPTDQLKFKQQPSKSGENCFQKNQNSEEKDEESSVPFSVTPEVERTGRMQLEESLKLIPNDEKFAYLEALRRAPHLVEKESNPTKFLRFDKFNAWAAARRLVSYWNKRNAFFGERTFLPLTLTGHGALSMDDVATLSTGYLALLPNDSRGRSVVCYDATRLPETGGDQLSRLRCTFYMMSVFMENELSIVDSAVCLIVMNTLGFERTRQMNAGAELLRLAIPMHVEYHIIVRPSERKKSFLQTMFPFLLKSLRYWTSTCHVGKSKEEVAEKMKACGFEHTPFTVGGNWSYENFTQWQRQRTRHERELHGHEVDARVEKTIAAFERGSRKKEKSLVSSQRKREREKQALGDLQKQCSKLKNKNLKLRKENSSLEGLLESCRKIIRNNGENPVQSNVASTGEGAARLKIPVSSLNVGQRKTEQHETPMPPSAQQLQLLIEKLNREQQVQQLLLSRQLSLLGQLHQNSGGTLTMPQSVGSPVATIQTQVNLSQHHQQAPAKTFIIGNETTFTSVSPPPPHQSEHNLTSSVASLTQHNHNQTSAFFARERAMPLAGAVSSAVPHSTQEEALQSDRQNVHTYKPSLINGALNEYILRHSTNSAGK